MFEAKSVQAAICQSGMVASRRLALLALVQLLPDAGERKLSLQAICEAAGLPDRTIRRALADLVAGGVIVVTHGGQAGRRNGVIRGWSLYRLRWDQLRSSLSRAREFIRDRLDAVFARNQVRMARRAAQLVALAAGKQRPATLAGVLSQESVFPSLASGWRCSNAEIEAKVVRDRAIWAEIGRMSPDDAAAAMAAML